MVSRSGTGNRDSMALLEVAEGAQAVGDERLVVGGLPAGHGRCDHVVVVAEADGARRQELLAQQRGADRPVHGARYRQAEQVERGRRDRLDRVLPVRAGRRDRGPGEEVETLRVMRAGEAELVEGPEDRSRTEVAAHALVDHAAMLLTHREEVGRLADEGAVVEVLAAMNAPEHAPALLVAQRPQALGDAAAHRLVFA